MENIENYVPSKGATVCDSMEVEQASWIRRTRAKVDSIGVNRHEEKDHVNVCYTENSIVAAADDWIKHERNVSRTVYVQEELQLKPAVLKPWHPILVTPKSIVAAANVKVKHEEDALKTVSMKEDLQKNPLVLQMVLQPMHPVVTPKVEDARQSITVAADNIVKHEEDAIKTVSMKEDVQKNPMVLQPRPPVVSPKSIVAAADARAKHEEDALKTVLMKEDLQKNPMVLQPRPPVLTPKLKREESSAVPSPTSSNAENAVSSCNVQLSCVFSLTERQLSDIKSFNCNICDAKLTRLRSLKHHMSIHTRVKPFHCTLCEKKYTISRSLKRHMYTHKKQDNSVKRITRSYYLRHTKERYFSCKKCDKTFTRLRRLNCHMRVHTGEKPLNCTVCDERFYDSRHLNKHIQQHSSGNLINCRSCGKKFAHLESLRSHMRVHDGERPFSCENCHKTFTQLDYLEKHMRVHENEE